MVGGLTTVGQSMKQKENRKRTVFLVCSELWNLVPYLEAAESRRSEKIGKLSLQDQKVYTRGVVCELSCHLTNSREGYVQMEVTICVVTHFHRT